MQSQPIVMLHFDMSRFSQESLTIIGVGVALAALILTGLSGVRSEFQAVRAEARADREALRAEARADREAMRAEHETFRNQILRLTEQQGVLSARLDSLSGPLAPTR